MVCCAGRVPNRTTPEHGGTTHDAHNHDGTAQVACGAEAPPVIFNKLGDKHGASDYIALGGAPQGEPPLPVVAGPLNGKLNLEEELVRRFPAHVR